MRRSSDQRLSGNSWVWVPDLYLLQNWNSKIAPSGPSFAHPLACFFNLLLVEVLHLRHRKRLAEDGHPFLHFDSPTIASRWMSFALHRT